MPQVDLQSSRPAIKDLQSLVEAFRLSIIHKDKASYLGLFLSDRGDRIGWQSVLEDSSLSRIRRNKPSAQKVGYRADNTFIALIEEVCSSPSRFEETFSNLSIDSDGDVASVTFDYQFKENGEVSNVGKEHWQVVRTSTGWKIFSVIYSVRLPGSDKVPPLPKGEPPVQSLNP